MRRIVVSVVVLVSSCLAAELKIKVVDPQNAAVPHARVAVYRAGQTTPLAVASTSGEGRAEVRALMQDSEYRVEVFASGFAPRQLVVRAGEGDALVTTELRLAAPGETVEVSATLTPLPSDESAAEVSSLNTAQLTTMMPTSAAETLRFLPGAVVADAGRRGGLSSLFVRGGESRYTKVLVDGVPVNDPGGTFDFGAWPADHLDRLEFVRGAESTLYGSDAMTGVVEMWSRTGTTRTPEFRFGADGGTFSSAHGYASVAGARGRFDYNLFGDQFNSEGQGVNDAYSNSAQGGNLGVALSPRAFLRFRARHSNSRSGVQSFWNFNGRPLVPPDTDQSARQNNFLASAEFTLAAPNRWQHRFTGFEYNHQRHNVDNVMDLGRETSAFGFAFNFDTPFNTLANINRAGLDYQGEYWARSWARSVFGYHFEDENGWIGDPEKAKLAPAQGGAPMTHGLRRNHAVFGQQIITWGRLSAVGGARFEHNETFGNRVVPRVATSLLVARGGEFLSGTRLRFVYAEGIKEPRLEESFANDAFTIPNPNLKAEENRSFEAGLLQNFFAGKHRLAATYFHNLFRNQIDYAMNPETFVGQYVNVNRALAHGAEVAWHSRPWSHLSLDVAYTYTSTQILNAPFAFDPLLDAGRPLIRRPKHAGSLLATWITSRWGASVGVVAIGRRGDSDFLGLQPSVTYAAGYGRMDLGIWRALTPRLTAYANIGNLLNRHYEAVAGYPALRFNIRAGMRVRVGGE
ncbi:MAG: TonB-dependent receptor [Terriglobales bacterium]